MYSREIVWQILIQLWLGMVVDTFNPSTQVSEALNFCEFKAGLASIVPGQLVLHTETLSKYTRTLISNYYVVNKNNLS